MVEVIGDIVMPSDFILPLVTDAQYTAGGRNGELKLSGSIVIFSNGTIWTEIIPTSA